MAGLIHKSTRTLATDEDGGNQMRNYILQPNLFGNEWTIEEQHRVGDTDQFTHKAIAEISFDKEGRLSAQGSNFCLKANLEDTLEAFADRVFDDAHLATSKAVKIKDETLDMFA